MNNYYVYMYMDQNNVPFYIGKGKKDRWNLYNHNVGHTYAKIKSIGRENVKVHFLHKGLTEEETICWEKYWIKYLGRKDNGTGQLTNHTDGGEGLSGHIMSAEHKENLSKALKGRIKDPFSKEHRKNIGKALKGKGLGKKKSKEHRRKISDAQKGKILSKEIKCKMREAAKGRKHTEETKRRISKANKGLGLGRKLSEETKRKIGETRKNKFSSN